MKYYVYQQYSDCDSEHIKTFDNIEDIYKSEIDELMYCHNEFPDDYIHPNRMKTIQFTDWGTTHNTIQSSEDAVFYLYKECDINNWKFFPLNSTFSDGIINNRWFEYKN